MQRDEVPDVVSEHGPAEVDRVVQDVRVVDLEVRAADLPGSYHIMTA